MAAGNRHLGYKELLNELEDGSPGSKAAFLLGYFERAHSRFAGDAASERADLRPCPECGAPTTGDICAFCSLRARATVGDEAAVELVARRTARGRSSGRSARRATAPAPPGAPTGAG